MPWNQRKALLSHHRWFRNLVEFHDITRSWLEDSQSERAAHHLERAPHPQLPEDFRLLNTLPDARLDSLLDDTTPEDLLGRLEYSVWTVQAWTYTTLVARLRRSASAASSAESPTFEDDLEKLHSVFEQSAWKQGRLVAEKRWNSAEKQTLGIFHQDLRGLFLTLVDSPVAASQGEDAFLLRRGLPRELEFEFRACPHLSKFSEIAPVANELCRFHSAWIRGYVYGLNHQVQVEYQPCSEAHSSGSVRHCRQHWRL
jgi:hypothetical protein